MSLKTYLNGFCHYLGYGRRQSERQKSAGIARPFRVSKAKKARAHLVLETLEDRSLMSVSVGSSFAGLGFPDSGLTPPDTMAAAGPSHVVEVVNSRIAFFDKFTCNLVSQQSLTNFFAPVKGGNFIFDPSVTYDELANRFVIVALDDSFAGGTSFLDVAVSNDSDPTHGFTEMQRIDVHSGMGKDLLLGDFPRLGWNADAYVITMNMYHTNGTKLTTFDHVRLVTMQKASLLDQNKATFTDFVVDRAGAAGANLTPAVMHGSQAGSPMWFVESPDLGGNAVSVIEMTNVLNNAPNFATTPIAVTAFQLPPAAGQPGNGAGTIDTGDNRILNAAWRNNRLVACQNVGTGGLAHARWYEFNTGSAAPTLTQWGEINRGAGVNTYFPSIEINSVGDLGMTFMESSSTEFMSMYVTGQLTLDPAGTMEAPVLVYAGQRTYSSTGFGEANGPFRAGDYSGISVDPITDRFWAANEYATAATAPPGALTFANWGTQIADFLPGVDTGPRHPFQPPPGKFPTQPPSTRPPR
jgi:hypothetical protein